MRTSLCLTVLAISLNFSHLHAAEFIGAGRGFSVELRRDGTIFCQGLNSHGQLGNGTIGGTSPSPSQVQNISGAKEVASGDDFVVALLGDGSVVAWGSDSAHQLGPQASGDSATPVTVTGLPPIRHISAGHNHVIAVDWNGKVWCWGDNSASECGSGASGASISTPVQVPGICNVKSVCAGNLVSVALTAEGKIAVWGDNSNGALGVSGPSSGTPTFFSSICGIKAIAAYRQILALNSEGKVFAWGYGVGGELGLGTLTSTNTPTQIPGIAHIKSVVAMGDNSGLIDSAGVCYFFGANEGGSLGLGMSGPVSTPTTQNPSLTGATELAGSSDHYIAFLPGFGTVAGGLNGWGQLGIGSTLPLTSTWFQSMLSDYNGFSVIAAGNATTYMLAKDQMVRDAGRNDVGQLGRGTTSTNESVGVIPNLFNVTDIAAGDRFGLAILTTSQVKMWGNNDYGQLATGDTTDRDAPVLVPGLTGVIDKAVGADFVVVITNTHSVLSWGRSNHYQTGLATTTPVTTPTVVTGYTGTPLKVSAGGGHCLLLTTTGLYAFGQNDHGECGLSTMTDVQTPTLVTGITGVISQISAGRHHSAVLTSTGLWVFGADANGALGDTGSTDRASPFNLTASANPPPSSPILVWTGNDTTYYEDASGLIYGTGLNATGVLANGSTTNSNSFAPTTYFGVGLACGLNHTVGLYPSIIFAAGADDYGQLCDGGTTTAIFIQPTAFLIPGINNYISNGAGAQHSLAVDESGIIWGWGNGTAFCGGSGNVLSPTPLTSYPNPYFFQVSGGRGYSLAVDTSGNPWVAGSCNSLGQLGTGTTTAPSQWVEPGTLTGILKSAAGGTTSYYLRDDGELFAAGDGGASQLGGTTQSSTPIQITSLHHIIDIASGGAFLWALRDDGRIFGIGAGTSGQLSGTANSSTPVELPISEAIAIAAGDAHGLIVTADGKGFTLGSNSDGQAGLGNLTTASTSTPVQVVTGAVSPAAGYNFSLFNLGNGVVMGAGADNANQLNDALETSNPTFSQVPDLGAIYNLVSGGAHSIATMVVGGEPELWGSDEHAELGDGQASPLPPPIVTNFVATANATNPTSSVDFTWTASPGAANYTLESSTDAGVTWSVLTGLSGTATSFTATGLNPGTTYQFAISAVNPGGQSPAITTASSLTTGYVTPVTPTSVLAMSGIPYNDTPNVMTVSWTISGQTDATEYDIQEENADGSFSTIYTVAGNVNSATISGISSTASPTIRVVAANPAGMSTSATTTLTSPIVARPRYIPLYLGNPNFIATSIANNGVVVGLDHDPASGADGTYYLQRWHSGILGTLTASGTHVSTYNAEEVQWYPWGANNNGEVVGSIQPGNQVKALYWGTNSDDATPLAQPTFTVNAEEDHTNVVYESWSYLANNAIDDSSKVYGTYFNGTAVYRQYGAPFSTPYYPPGSTVQLYSGTNLLTYGGNNDGFSGAPNAGPTTELGSAPPFTYTPSGFVTTNNIPLYAGTGLVVYQQLTGLVDLQSSQYAAQNTSSGAIYPLSFKPLGVNNAGIVWGTNSATGVDCWWDMTTQIEHDLPAGFAVRSINSRQFTNGSGIQPDFQIAGGYVYSMTRDSDGNATGWSTNKVETYGGWSGGGAAINDNGVIVGGGYLNLPATIQRDGADITATNNTVAVGQQINLTTAISPVIPASAISYQWTIPGYTDQTAFKSYNPTLSNSGQISLFPSDLTNSYCNFYWSAGGYHTVTCQTVIYGQTNTMSATLHAVGPTANVKVTPGTISADSNYETNGIPVTGPWLHYGAPIAYYGQGPGMDFLASVTEPADYSGGTFEWIQIIPSWTMHAHFLNGKSYTYPTLPGLDGLLPYLGYPDNPLHTTDSPGMSLPSLATNASIDFTAKMYLMWRPPTAALHGDHSVLVPVSAVSWGWSASAQDSSIAIAPAWTRNPSSAGTIFTNGPATDEPFWTRLETNLPAHED